MECNLILQNKGYSCYEIGDVYMSSQKYKTPSVKELSISTFKQRFGGRLLPKVYWYKKLR